MKIKGAGISGLTLAYYLRKHRPIVYERTERPGGWIRSVEKNGFLFEMGPRGFRPHADTLELVHELGLTPLPASKAARSRFILQGDQLKPFSLLMLLKNGLLRDLFTKPSKREDESIADFFQRHFGKSFVENIADPLVKGIFAGDIEKLSCRACFPKLWELDQKRGRLLHLPKRQGAPLYSFVGGMEMLPKALSKEVEIRFESTYEGKDALIACRTDQALPYLSLTTINMGWHQKQLPKRGFGFLVHKDEQLPFLGMTFDSNVFPEQKGGSRVCVMTLEKEGKAIALDAVERFLGLKHPDALIESYCHEAIPQYPVGYTAIDDNVGHNCSINGCIEKAKAFAKHYDSSPS